MWGTPRIVDWNLDPSHFNKEIIYAACLVDIYLEEFSGPTHPESTPCCVLLQYGLLYGEVGLRIYFEILAELAFAGSKELVFIETRDFDFLLLRRQGPGIIEGGLCFRSEDIRFVLGFYCISDGYSVIVDIAGVILEEEKHSSISSSAKQANMETLVHTCSAIFEDF